jgi:hypothetical protein
MTGKPASRSRKIDLTAEAERYFDDASLSKG